MAEQSKTKAVRCVRDVRNAKLEEYRLPDDGREWKHVARNRQALANYLATFAFGNGTSIYPSVKTIAEHFGAHRASVFRWLADLRALKLLNDKEGLHGHRGTAIRSLNMSTFTGAALAVQATFAGNQESQTHEAGVANSSEQESQTHEQESQTHEQESQTHEQESHTGATQPSFDRPQTVHLPSLEIKSGGGKSLSEKNLATIGAFGKRTTELDALISIHGFAVVDKGLNAVVAEGFGADVKSKVSVALFRLPAKIAEIEAQQLAALDDAVRANNQDAFVEACTQLTQIAHCWRCEYGIPCLSAEDRAATEHWKLGEGHSQDEIHEFMKIPFERREYLVAACNAACKARPAYDAKGLSAFLNDE